MHSGVILRYHFFVNTIFYHKIITFCTTREDSTFHKKILETISIFIYCRIYFHLKNIEIIPDDCSPQYAN